MNLPPNLPSAVRAKLEAMEDHDIAQHGAVLALVDQERELVATVQAIDLETSRLARDDRHVDPARLKTLAPERAEVMRKIERVRAAREAATAEWQAGKALTGRLVGDLSENRLAIFKRVTVKLPRGATVESVRADIGNIEADIGQVEAAPLPAADLRRLAFRHIDQLAQAGEPLVWRRAEGSPVDLTRPHLSFLIWLATDLVKARIADLIGEDRPGALTEQERERKLAALAARKLELERVEEALIEAAEAEGRTIARRPDADPRAILGIEIIGR